MAACSPSMTLYQTPKRTPWIPVDAARAVKLADARLQLHHAAQLATALGISYLEKKPDDSHTNLEWLPALDALASNPAGARNIRIAVRPREFAILVVATPDLALAEFALTGKTLDEAVRWIRARLGQYGLDPARFTTARHYEIPSHRVADGHAFDADALALDELAHWYRDAAAVLGEFATKLQGASPVRCWPHHFDIATLIDRGEGKSVGLGMEPGDVYYDEPYWYANAYPAPALGDAPPALGGNGAWHTHEWTGAVLVGSRMGDVDQGAQVARFFQSALRAYGVNATS